jgi:putative transcriptional regulator
MELKQFREKLNKTPKEMSSEMSISKSLYYKVESGLREPSYCFLKKFKEAFKVSVDEIFFDALK